MNTIANALAIWDNFSIPSTNNGTPFDYYQLLSWSGKMRQTQYFTDQGPNFTTYSIAVNKAEEGVIFSPYEFSLAPKGTNTCPE